MARKGQDKNAEAAALSRLTICPRAEKRKSGSSGWRNQSIRYKKEEEERGLGESAMRKKKEGARGQVDYRQTEKTLQGGGRDFHGGRQNTGGASQIGR